MASNALTILGPGQMTPMEQHAAYIEEKREIIKRLCIPQKHLNNEALFENFIEISKLTGLNPIRKQLYCIDYGQGPSIVTGIDGLRLIAARSQHYAGGDPIVWEREDGATLPTSATCTVYRLVGGIRCPFTCTVRWDEFGAKPYRAAYANNWKTMPFHMLGKVAESHALRRAFPEETSGLYTTDEMAQSDHATSEPRDAAQRAPGPASRPITPPARSAPLSAPRARATMVPNGAEEQRRKLVEEAQARGVNLTEDMESGDMAAALNAALTARGLGARVVRNEDGTATARALHNALLAFPPRTVDTETGEVVEDDPYAAVIGKSDDELRANLAQARLADDGR